MARGGTLPGLTVSASLTPDCTRCAALCCSLPFTRGREFPEDKPDESPCRHLTPELRCGHHDRLWESGWRGCVTFDCFGAGQQVVQVTYAGAHDGDPEQRRDVFAVMRQLHELRFLLQDPACAASSYAAPAAELDAALARVADGPAEELAATDPARWRARAGALFSRVAAERGGSSYRGALLLAADLRRVELRDADLLGADLRDADVRGADLSRTLFLTQPQVTAARGDDATRLPSRVVRPAHWSRG